MRSPSSHQLLQQPVLPIRLLKGCGFTLYNSSCMKCLPGCFSPLNGAPAAAFPPLTGAREVSPWMGKRTSPAPIEETALPFKMCSSRHCPEHRLGQSSANTPLGRLSGKAWHLQEKREKISWITEGRRRWQEVVNSSLQRARCVFVPHATWVAMALQALRALSLQLFCQFQQCHALRRYCCRGLTGTHHPLPHT